VRLFGRAAAGAAFLFHVGSCIGKWREMLCVGGGGGVDVNLALRAGLSLVQSGFSGLRARTLVLSSLGETSTS